MYLVGLFSSQQTVQNRRYMPNILGFKKVKNYREITISGICRKNMAIKAIKLSGNAKISDQILRQASLHSVERHDALCARSLHLII